MKKFTFLITDRKGNTSVERFATKENTEEAALKFAYRMFPGCKIEPYVEESPLWTYILAGIALGSVIFFLFVNLIK